MSEILDRISELSRRAREATDAAKLIQAQRDSLIVEAIDTEGQRAGKVATAAGISRARVTVILGNAAFTDLV